MTFSWIKSRLALGGMLAGLALAVVSAPASAQTTTTPPGTATTPPATTAPDYRDTRDDGFDWGWLGLIGLAGLYGLTGKRRDYDTTAAGYRGTSDTTVRRS